MRSSRKAFTLIELLIAIVILLVVITGTLLTYLSCVVLNDSGHNLTVAVNDAQTVLEQVKSLAYNQIAAYTPPVFTNLTDENVALSKAIGSQMATIIVTVSWVERQRARALSLKTYVAR
jgi:prepilin-type N-terminal cleavage/methylation domain-containing protein